MGVLPQQRVSRVESDSHPASLVLVLALMRVTDRFEKVTDTSYSVPVWERRQKERHAELVAAGIEPNFRMLNGDVAYCCEDMYGELSKLNIFQTSIRDVWYGARHAKIVKTLLMGDRQEFDLCAKCTMGPNRYFKDPMHETRHFDR